MSPQFNHHPGAPHAGVPLPAAGQPVGLSGLGEALAGVVITLAVALAVTVLVAAFLAERRSTGEPSFISRRAAREARFFGRPLWEPLAFHVALAGLAIALLGWRALDTTGPLRPLGVTIAVLGLAVTLVGGVIAGALAHPPHAMEGHAGDDIVHPARAHHAVTRRGRLGAGPVGAPMIIGGAVVALLAVPIAALARAVAGDAADTFPGHLVVEAAVALCCLGAWVLHAEGRRTAAHLGGLQGAGAGGFDLGEAVSATAALLAVSVAVDSGLPTPVAAALGVPVLLAVRWRTTAGVALAVAVAYVVARAGVAALTLSPDRPIVPLAWQVVVAAIGAEVVGTSLRGAQGRAAGSGRR